MRHRRAGRKFNKSSSHRRAMFRNMAKSLLEHGRIRTTEQKAKELRKVAEKLITLALRNDVHSRRQAYKVLESHQLVKKLFDEIGPRFVGVKGGYTRVVKLALPRRGDAASLAVIEFTRQGEAEAPAEKPAAAPVKEEKKAEPKKEEPKAEEAPAEETPAEEAEEAPAEEVAEEAPAEEPKAEEK